MNVNVTDRHSAAQVKYVAEAKFLLILGIVLAHCNLAGDFSPEVVHGSAGLQVVNFISGHLLPGCVPLFFFISGYLFFKSSDTFTPGIYVRKLRRRVRTLLVPYLIWCTVCAFIMYLKCRFQDFPGRDIFLSGNRIDVVNFIKGYWSISEGNGLPFAGAFWFIRNLMVFVVLSPVAWVIGRRWWLTLIVFLVCVVMNTHVYGWLWFLSGCCAGCYRLRMPEVAPWQGVAAMAAAIGVCFAGLCLKGPLWVRCLQYSFMLIAVVYLAQVLARHIGNMLIFTCVNATFFIYAFHQCFCFRIHMLWIHLIGVETFGLTLATYFATFFSILVICMGVYVVLRKFTPGVLSVITGGRE